MILKLKRTPGLYLVGFMGCGKSTIGRMLAEEIGWTFVDIDEEIERSIGMTIGAFFDSRGETEFRKIEHETLRRVVQKIERGQPFVVALGGGAFAQPKNYELLENNGVSIWLDCPLTLVEQRVARHTHRPLARDIEKLRELYRVRSRAYGNADFRIEIVDSDPGTNLASVLRLPLFQ